MANWWVASLFHRGWSWSGFNADLCRAMEVYIARLNLVGGVTHIYSQHSSTFGSQTIFSWTYSQKSRVVMRSSIGGIRYPFIFKASYRSFLVSILLRTLSECMCWHYKIITIVLELNDYFDLKLITNLTLFGTSFIYQFKVRKKMWYYYVHLSYDFVALIRCMYSLWIDWDIPWNSKN